MYILIDLVIYINFKQKFQSGTLIEFGKQLRRQDIFLYNKTSNDYQKQAFYTFNGYCRHESSLNLGQYS